MNIDVKQLEINVNLHAMQPDFLNLELHYVIAENENTFRFAGWDELPQPNEQMFYCFLTEKDLLIPAGNVLVKESYVIATEPLYPVIRDCKGFVAAIDVAREKSVAKAVRHFSNEELSSIKNELQEAFHKVETHVVASPVLKHHLFVVDDVEISVAPTMVYFRTKAPFADNHYESAQQQA